MVLYSVFFLHISHPTGVTVIVLGRFLIGMDGPGRYLMIRDGVVGVYCFVGLRCKNEYGVRTVRGRAV